MAIGDGLLHFGWRLGEFLPVRRRRWRGRHRRHRVFGLGPFARGRKRLGLGRNQRFAFRRRSRRRDVRHYVHFFALLDLQETGRQAIGLGVYVELVVSAGQALRRQSQGAPLDFLQRGNFFGTQQQVVFDPAFRAARRAHLQKAAAALHDFEPIAVPDRGHHRRLQRDVPAQAQRGRTGVGFADRRSARFAAPARRHDQQQEC